MTRYSSMRVGLAALLGDTPAPVFVERHWQRAPWRGHTVGLRSLLDIPEVEEYLSLGRLGVEALRVFKDTEQVSQHQYTISDGLGATVVRPERLAELFSDGAALILEAVHLRFPKVAAFCTALGEELGHPVQANAYYSPPRGTAFRLHHDTHDVFVIQLTGAKTWEVRDPVVELPLRRQRFDPEEMRAGPVVWTGELHPGDVLYLPRGWLHRAETSNEASLHLTVGVLVRTWYEQLLDAVRAASLEHIELRKSVHSCEADEVLPILAAELEPAARQSRGRDRRRATNNPPLAGRFADLRDNTVTGSEVLQRRGEVWLAVAQGDGRVALELAEKTITFPAKCAVDLNWLAVHREPFTPTNLPGPLTREERCVFLSRLLREGVVTKLRDKAAP
jgi:lysine-specific demethylase/histidyl-hydroxylase NO66